MLACSFSWPGWLPSIDGKTLSDQPIRLLNQGKIAKVPVISACISPAIDPRARDAASDPASLQQRAT